MLGNDLLLGEKTRLTPISLEDVPTVTRWFSSNMEMLRHLSLGVVFPSTQADEEEWINDALQGKAEYYPFIIRVRETDQAIGGCSLNNLNWQSRWASVGIFIGESELFSQGYGSDALRVLLRYGFMELNLHRIELGVMSYNDRAIASYTKVGFQPEGVLRQQVWRDGQVFDVHMMSVLRREWEAHNKA